PSRRELGMKKKLEHRGGVVVAVAVVAAVAAGTYLVVSGSSLEAPLVTEDQATAFDERVIDEVVDFYGSACRATNTALETGDRLSVAREDGLGLDLDERRGL